MKARALLIAIAVAVAGCREPAPLGVPTSLLGVPLSGDGLLTCAPLAYDSVTQTIGPEGGTLTVGPHALTIPPGALDGPVSISAVAPTDSVNRVRIRPAGGGGGGDLAFRQPASLRMSYANCDVLSSTLPKRIAAVTDALLVLEYLLSVDDPFTQSVTGEVTTVNSTADYAIAW